MWFTTMSYFQDQCVLPQSCQSQAIPVLLLKLSTAAARTRTSSTFLEGSPIAAATSATST